jgi:short-subunit dehydrogenase
VANAGVGARRDVHPASWEAMAAALHTNFCGAAATLTALVEPMIARRRGHLVGISSLASYGALPGSAAYCAPKAGLAMLLDCLRLDTRGTGVTVTRVDLGFVATEMVAKSTHPMPQLLSAEDAAERIVTGLATWPPVLAIPQPLAAAIRALGLLPRSLRDRLASALNEAVSRGSS